MRPLSITFVLLTCLSLAGVVSAGEDRTAQIFVYSQWESGQRDWLPVFYDGALVAKVKDGGFFAIDASFGQHVLVAGDGIPITLQVHSTDPTFVRIGRHIEIAPSGKNEIPVLELRSSERGRIELVHLVYVTKNKIYSPLVAEKDPTVDWKPGLKDRKKTE